jgi:hypothetical protein
MELPPLADEHEDAVLPDPSPKPGGGAHQNDGSQLTVLSGGPLQAKRPRPGQLCARRVNGRWRASMGLACACTRRAVESRTSTARSTGQGEDEHAGSADGSGRLATARELSASSTKILSWPVPIVTAKALAPANLFRHAQAFTALDTIAALTPPCACFRRWTSPVSPRPCPASSQGCASAPPSGQPPGRSRVPPAPPRSWRPWPSRPLAP